MNELKLQEYELDKLCQKLNNTLQEGHIVLLEGDIGSGKTTLVRRFINSFDKNSQVNSPTFNLSLCYENPKYGTIYHYDMYRKTIQDMLELGFLDMLTQKGLHFVEWGGKTLKHLLVKHGFKVMLIHITPTSTQHRIYKVNDE